MLTLVAESSIPSTDVIVDVPTNNLLEIYKTCLQLEAICEQADGIGISAVQAGLPWKLFLVKSDGSADFAHKGEYGYFVNSTYTPTTDTQVVSLEGCLSLRSQEGRLRRFQVERYTDIRVTGHQLRLPNNQFMLEKCEYELGVSRQSIVFQHEVDHHLGKLISHLGEEVFLWK